MKPLDDYIRGHLDQFNSLEPQDDHYDRFADKLERLNASRRTGPWITLLKIAAVLVIGFVLLYTAIREFRSFTNDSRNSPAALSDPELNEAVEFYATQLDVSYNKIKNLRFNDDQNEKKQVLHELTEMDRQVQAMEQDLKQNPDDERVVHAIINFYQIKIELMDVIIARAQQSSNSIL